MAGWLAGRMDGWMDWMDAWIEGWLAGWLAADGCLARVPRRHMSIGDSLGAPSTPSDAVHTCGWAGGHVCSQMAMHSIFGVCSAAQKCTLSVEALNFDEATCGSTKYNKTSDGEKLGVDQKCQYKCKLGYYYSTEDPETQCKVNPDTTSAEGIWDPAGCEGA